MPTAPRREREPEEERRQAIEPIRDRDPNYEVTGLQVFVHYLRNLKDYFKAKVQVTLYEGVGIVKQDNHEDCNWVTKNVDKANNQLVAPRGSKIEIGLDGKIEILKDPSMVNRPRDFGTNQIGETGHEELILNVDQDVMWQRDLYNMIWDHNLKDNLFLLVQVFIVST